MTTAVEQATVAPLVKYDVSEAQIAAARARCAVMTCDTPAGYEEVRIAIAELRGRRVAIEKARVGFKADALAFGRLVDSEARRWTVALEEIEGPLKLKKAAVDDEADRVKREAEAEKIRALEAEIAANRARQEAEAKAVRDAEEARLATERVRLEAERAALAEERRLADDAARVLREATEAAQATERARLAQVEAAQRVEREAIEAERRAVAAEREKADRIEFERQAKIKAETEAKAQAERDRLAAAAHQAELDALKPDLQKIRAFAESIRALALTAPKTKTKKAVGLVAGAITGLGAVAVALDAEADRWK